MASHLSCYELLAAQHAASPVIGPHRTWTVSQVADEFVDLDPTILSENLDTGWIPPSAYRCQNFTDTPIRHLFGSVHEGVTVAAIEAQAGTSGASLTWAINGVAVSNGAQTVFEADPDPQWCRLCPPVRFAIADAAAAALLAIVEDPDSFSATVHFAYPKHLSYQGLLHFMDLEDRPSDTDASGYYRLHALLQQVGSPSARQTLGATAGGTSLYAYDCNLATFSPEGLLFIDPSDIGNGPDQIPGAVQDNTAARLRCHPSTFLRRADYVRHLTRQLTDHYPIGQLNQLSPLTFAIVGSAPTYSRWLISVDGCPYVVQIGHGTRDLRRPRDVWNELWVPLLQSSQSNYLPISLLGYDGVQTGIVTVLSRLRYLDYARMLGCDGQVTYHTQTGTERLG
jgi:hypothetical protein